MSINAVGPNVQVQQSQKKTGGTKRAVASAIIPGLGQFQDGRKKAAAGFFGGMVGLYTISALFNRNIYMSLLKRDINKFNAEMNKSSLPKMITTEAALFLATVSLWITNVVNAYKGDKNSRDVNDEE